LKCWKCTLSNAECVPYVRVISATTEASYSCYICHAPARIIKKQCKEAAIEKDSPARNAYNNGNEKTKEIVQSAYGPRTYLCVIIRYARNLGALTQQNKRIGCVKVPPTAPPRPYPRIAKLSANMDVMKYPATHLFIVAPFVESFRDKDGIKTQCEEKKAELGENERGTFLRPKMKIIINDTEIIVIFTPKQGE
jgi:hypothetical protein